MINIHLLVDESYIEELMLHLPREKVRVVEKNFDENKILLKNVLDDYKKRDVPFISYKESIESMNSWFDGRKIV